jgi:beta-galactosidase
VTLSRGGEEWVRAMKEIRQLREARPANPVAPRRYSARKTAFLYNVDNRNDLDNHPQTNRWDTVAHLLKYHRALKGLGAPVDVITEDGNFADYRFMVAPAYQLVDAALVKRWTQYVENGGHLILSARTGTKNRNGHLWEGAWAEPIRALIGADIPFYDALPAPHAGRVRSENTGAIHEWHAWADMMQPSAGTRVLATYRDQFYAGKGAAVSRTLGSGTVTYIGVETASGDLEKDIVRRVFTGAGVQIEDHPDQLIVDWRDGFWIASNFSSADRDVPAPRDATLIVGTRRLPPAGVAIWRE